MSLPVRFMSAFVPKDVLDEHFPGGILSFREAYPNELEDEGLVRFIAMNWADLEDTLAALTGMGVPIEESVAIAEMMLGPFESKCERIAFDREIGIPFDHWYARLTHESALTKAE